MEQISNLAKRASIVESESAENGLKSRSVSPSNQGQLHQTISRTDTINHRHMDRLWQRLSETFGAAFTTPYGHKPNQSWIDALRDLTVDEVRKGLDKLFTWESDFPPNALQFRDMCRPVTAPAHEIYKPLPKPPRNPKVVENALQQMKRLVQGETIRDSRESNLDLSNPNSGCTCKLKPDAAGLMNQFDRSCSYCRELDELRVML